MSETAAGNAVIPQRPSFGSRQMMRRRKSFCLGFVLFVSAMVTSADSAFAEGKRLGGRFVDHLIPIKGGQLCCAHRPGKGPTLVLIPGTFSDSRTFAKLISHLDESLNLLIIENRGLGLSWPPPEGGTIEQCARDALLITNQLAPETFYIGGHSLGGMISLEFGRISPEKLRGIISMEGWTNSDAARAAYGRDMKATLSPEQLAETAAYRKEVLARWSEEQSHSFAQAWKAWDGHDFLKQTKLPILEIYGDRGRPGPLREKLQIPDRKNIQFLVIENSSHKVHYQHPQKVAEAINTFITAQEAARRK